MIQTVTETIGNGAIQGSVLEAYTQTKRKGTIEITITEGCYKTHLITISYHSHQSTAE